MGDAADVIAALAALIAAIGVVWNGRQIKAVHESTNGKMEELLRVTKVAAEAKGRLDEKTEQASKNPL